VRSCGPETKKATTWVALAGPWPVLFADLAQAPSRRGTPRVLEVPFGQQWAGRQRVTRGDAGIERDAHGSRPTIDASPSVRKRKVIRRVLASRHTWRNVGARVHAVEVTTPVPTDPGGVGRLSGNPRPFRSNYERNAAPRKVGGPFRGDSHGISTVSTAEVARSLATRWRTMGSFIGWLELTPGHGFSLAQTGFPSGATAV
jgi:hypothetical protein